MDVTRICYRVHLLVLYAIVARDARAAQDLVGQNPTFFSYIQDFMWFKLALVRQLPSAGDAFAIAAPAASTFQIQDLQRLAPGKTLGTDASM